MKNFSGLKPIFAVLTSFSLLVFILLLASSPTIAQSGVTVTGRVSDQSGTFFFEGATVQIEELGKSTNTTRYGGYRFVNIPAGEYTLQVEYLGAQPIEVSISVANDNLVKDIVLSQKHDEEVLLVVGSSAAVASALNQERASDTLKTVVAATDVGKFPDQNIAESLQRLPGITIDRTDGEGRFVSVRGFDPNFTNVKLNGARVPSTETASSGDRAVALDVIPSELLENLEVSKVVTAEDDGDTFGGTVSVRSLSGFQRDGQYFSYKVEAGEDERSGDPAYKGSLIYSNLFADDTFGVAISAYYQNREYLVDRLIGDPDLMEDSGFRVVEDIAAAAIDLERERTAVSINLDYRPTDSSSYYLRFSRSELEELEFRNTNTFELDEGNEFTLTADGIGTIDEVRVSNVARDQEEVQEITSFSIGGSNIAGLWTIDYGASYAKSTRDETDLNASFRESVDGGFDFRIGTDGFVIGSSNTEAQAAINDPTRYGLRFFRWITEASDDRNTEFKLDFTREMDWGELQFGTKFLLHEKELDEERVDYFDEVSGSAAEDSALGDFRQIEPDYDLAEFGVAGDVAEIIAFYRSQLNPNGILGVGGNLALTEGRAITAARRGVTDDYDSEEDILSLYAMANIDIDDNQRLNFGVRVEQTDFQTSGFLVDEENITLGNALDGEGFIIGDEIVVSGGITPIAFKNDYTNVLPSVNYRWNIRDDLIFRAAFFQSVVRPTFVTNNSTVEFDFDDDGDDPSFDLDINAGNPELDPFSANNYDLNIAWYPGDGLSVLQLGVFYKDIDDWIFEAAVGPNSSIAQEIIERGGLQSQLAQNIAAGGDLDIGTNLNGDTARVKGVEISYYQEYPYGFSLGANATFTDSELDIGSREIPLAGQAEEIGNLRLGWQNDTWDVSLSVAYTGDFLDQLRESAGEDGYQSERTQVDMGVVYTVNDHIEVYFSGINLTREVEDQQFGRANSGFIDQYNNIERTYLMGVRGYF